MWSVWKKKLDTFFVTCPFGFKIGLGRELDLDDSNTKKWNSSYFKIILKVAQLNSWVVKSNNPSTKK